MYEILYVFAIVFNVNLVNIEYFGISLEPFRRKMSAGHSTDRTVHSQPNRWAAK